jgi:GDP-D-mannose 3',5'-epimerase
LFFFVFCIFFVYQFIYLFRYFSRTHSLYLSPLVFVAPGGPHSYGIEKLMTEELCMHYGQDFGIAVRIGRYHNIYGPHGTWKGGREKAPAAFCRKAITATSEFEMWGNGEQTRSFCYIDDCVEGTLRLMRSDYGKPLNIGSDEKVTMNEMADIALEIKGAKVPIKHIPGPEGVRGRNSDNTLIKEVLGWAPSIALRDGLKRTFVWIAAEIEKEKAAGVDDTAGYSTSKVFAQTTESLDKLSAKKE